jgi:hypothetical protein
MITLSGTLKAGESCDQTKHDHAQRNVESV